MRVVAGIYKGRRFPAKLPTGIRPTADAVRESIFNTLSNLLSFEDISVLDLFAGSGALGIEALSRGAAGCIWVEKSRKASLYIRNTLKGFGIDCGVNSNNSSNNSSNNNSNNENDKNENNDKNKIVTKPALQYLSSIDTEPPAAFGLVFADPPYALKTCNNVLNLIIEKNILSTGGIIVLEHGFAEHILVPEELVLLSDKKYGETKVEVLRRV